MAAAAQWVEQSYLNQKVGLILMELTDGHMFKCPWARQSMVPQPSYVQLTKNKFTKGINKVVKRPVS